MKYIERTVAAVLAVLLLTLCSSCNGRYTVEVTPTPTLLPSTAAGPDGGESEDVLILVNPWNPIPESYGAELKQLENGQSVAEVCYDALQEMLDACRQAGHHADVCSGYRNIVLQTQLYQDKVSRMIQEGHSRRKAERLAAMEVAYPGTSEHHTGLAVDIVDAANYNLDESQAQMPAQQWLMENCHHYGFILRYPEGKSDITGIIYEPWHYRYVGKEAAVLIHEEGLCLEEYLNLYR